MCNPTLNKKKKNEKDIFICYRNYSSTALFM